MILFDWELYLYQLKLLLVLILVIVDDTLWLKTYIYNGEPTEKS